MLIDFHTHIFPDFLAEKALKKLGDNSALKPDANGTLAGLKASMKKTNVDISVVLGIATNAKQQKSVNDFAASVASNSIIPFGSVYPDAPDALEELERIKAMGLKGVKFHPEFQQFFPDDEKMKPLYKKISSLGLITVFHAGEDYGYPPPYRAMPKNMASALKWFESPVVAAHMGGLGCGEEVLKTLCGLPIYFDISFAYGTTSKPLAEMIIKKHGADKILFGTDSPWHSPNSEKMFLDFLDLSKEEKELIRYKNAAKLLDLTEIDGACVSSEI